ncbi:MAG: c-type cytochrome [Sporocytophaga sp.]|uniref:cytochrome-c peroxidase n=1 Tax=Sporocytophaga sp. TaxID=2231183 RepID=UPI001B019A94|nr:cytochrome c peroxidase [Sporocytophaga sp.]MBO9701862.1 c-type cytochrome [Sporocytophaga sp.]
MRSLAFSYGYHFVAVRNYFIYYIPCVLLLLTSCKKDKEDEAIEKGNMVITLQLPKGFLYPDIPPDNLPTQNRIELGKLLFFDPILSRDSTISCGTCHLPDKLFADKLPKSIGIEGRIGERNAPSLLNVAYQPSLFWDGGNPTLEQQVLAPIDNHNEMDFDVNKVVERLKKHAQYPLLFQKAYNQEPSVYALTRAIACFERTLYGGSSAYDEYSDKKPNALTPSQINGMNLFFGEEGECFHCHTGFTFTDNSFRNNGLYQVYADSGRARITQNPSDIGKFKVPSLRNVEKTSPYMHDGSMATLEEVIDHYSKGGHKHPNKSPIIQPLNLTDQQKDDLISFLKALTDR